MKIALGFFGLPRNSSITFASIERCFIEPASRCGECRLFHHLYLQRWVRNNRSAEDHAVPDCSYAPFTRSSGIIEEPALPPAWPFDEVVPYGDRYQDDYASLRNLILQLISLKKLWALMQDWRPDVAIVMRPDLLYHDAVTGSHLSYVAANQDRCLLPEWQWWGGYNDRFALCGRSAIEAYCCRLDLALEFCRRRQRPLHAESLLDFALKRSRIAVRTTRLRATRVRVDGTLKEEDFRIRPTLEGTKLRKLQAVGTLLLSRLNRYSRDERGAGSRAVTP